MCRLYGFRANELTKVECTLAYAQNALMSQSRADLRGTSHSDGWGIGYYEDAVPAVERRDTAAYQDLHFSVTAERMYAKTVLAHVRRATVGGPALENTHPFVYGHWVFAHNGTVRAFEHVGPRLERETEPRLLELRRGSTDSELVFYWLLSRMSRAGVDLRLKAPQEPLVRVMCEAVRTLDARCETAQAEKPAQLNFIITDGNVLVATRWRNSLSWVERHGVHDCEICGIPHIHHVTGTDYRAVVVASEPISHEDWKELPEWSVLLVGTNVETETHRI